MNTIIDWLNLGGARLGGFALSTLQQSTVLTALLFALDLTLRKKVRATVRYAIWMLALLKLACRRHWPCPRERPTGCLPKRRPNFTRPPWRQS